MIAAVDAKNVAIEGRGTINGNGSAAKSFKGEGWGFRPFLMRIVRCDGAGIFITGIPDHPIQNLTLDNIEIHLAGGGTTKDADAKVDEKPDTYPDINRFGKTLPAHGIFARHVDGLKLNRIQLTLDQSDVWPALVMEDVTSVVCTESVAPSRTVRTNGPVKIMEGFSSPK